MGDILIDATDYEAVRQALGVDSATVSDLTITSLNYLKFVEGEVKQLVTDWSDIMNTADRDQFNLKLGTAYWVAARLCGHLQRNESRSFKAGPFAETVTGKSVDWKQKAGELMEQAKVHFSRISTQTAVNRPALFTRDGPTRSHTNVPSADEWEVWEDRLEPEVLDWLQDEQETS